MDKTKLRAVLYTRVSSESQVDGFSLNAQEKTLRNYAAANNMTIQKVFREEGKSAYFTKTRPVFEQMLDYVMAGNVDVHHCEIINMTGET